MESHRTKKESQFTAFYIFNFSNQNWILRQCVRLDSSRVGALDLEPCTLLLHPNTKTHHSSSIIRFKSEQKTVKN